MSKVILLRGCILALKNSLNNCCSLLDVILMITSSLPVSTTADAPTSPLLNPHPSPVSFDSDSPNYGDFSYLMNGDDCIIDIPDSTTHKRKRNASFQLVGIELNPGPKNPKMSAVLSELKHVVKKKQEKKKQSLSPQVLVQNNRPVPRSRSGSSKYLSGEVFNPRADMAGYMNTLCDAEKHPPVRLGGETMVQTALTQLHCVTTINVGQPSGSFVVHPRIWNPILYSTSTSAPYIYQNVSGFTNASVTTLQSLAASGRVVSAKLKVYTTASATNDNGALTLGLSPRDDEFLGPIVEGIGAVATASIPGNQVSTGGYPIVAATQNIQGLPTQGFNEFQNMDWTDTMPLKGGGSVFWLPQDPQSMIFVKDRIAQQTTATESSASVTTTFNLTPICDPFFTVGFTGATATTSSIILELFLNIEYTVTSGANGVIETTCGSMNSVQAFEVVKRIGGNLQNTVEPSPEASLGERIWGGIKSIGSGVLKSGLGAASKYLFGSSDVGQTVGQLIGL